MRVDNDGDQDDPIMGPPRWVKVFAIIGVIVLLLLAFMLLHGHDGPGRHL